MNERAASIARWAPRMVALALCACAIPHARTRSAGGEDGAVSDSATIDGEPADGAVVDDAIADGERDGEVGPAGDDGATDGEPADALASSEAGADSGDDGATDGAIDASAQDVLARDVAVEASADASTDASADAGREAGADASADAGREAGADGGVACPAGQFDCGDGRCQAVLGTVNTCADSRADGVHVLTVGGTPWCSVCRNTAGGRWTLVLRVNGNGTGGRDPSRFRYDSPYWTNDEVYQPWALDAADDRECKLRGFAAMPFSAIRVVINTTDRRSGGEIVRSMPASVTSLRALFAAGDNQYPTLWTADDVLRTVMDTRLQSTNRRAGFNVRSGNDAHARVRIGAIGDESNPFGSPDSYMGLGGAIPSEGAGLAYSAGNIARWNGRDDRTIPLYGLVWVR